MTELAPRRCVAETLAGLAGGVAPFAAVVGVLVRRANADRWQRVQRFAKVS